MALTPDEQKKLNDLIQEGTKYARELGKTQAEQALKNAKDLQTAQTLVKGLRDEWEELHVNIDATYNTFRNIVDELRKSDVATNQLKKGYSSLASIGYSIQQAQIGNNDLSLKDIKNLKEKINMNKSLITQALNSYEKEKQSLENQDKKRKLTTEEKDRLTQLNALISEQTKKEAQLNDEVNVLLKNLKEIESTQRKTNNLLGLSGNLIKGAGNLMDNLGFSGLKTYLNFDKAHEAMEKTAKDIAENGKQAGLFGGKMTVLFAGLKELGGGLAKALFSPLTIITGILQTFLRIDTEAADLGKSMGISYDSASKYAEQLSIAAESTNSNYVRTKEMIQSVTTLNSLFGTNIKFSDQLLKDFSVLRDEIGLSEDQLVGLYRVNALNSNTLKQSASEVVATTLQFNNQNKTAFSSKTIMDGIAKSSAAARLNFRGSVPELVKAVGEAKKLGLELDQLNQIGRGLLNFEESISAELEAELLTGKQINLDKARYYALTNDSVGLARELQTQIGSAKNFGAMNVLQQESFARALGMSKEQLAEMLETTELLGGKYASMDKAQEAYNELVKQNKSHQEIIALMGKEELVNQLKSNSVQEEFGALIEKLKETLVNIVRGPLGDILRYIQEWFNMTDDKGIKNSTKLVEVFKSMLDPIKEIIQRVREWFKLPDEEGATGFEKLKNTIEQVIDKLKTAWQVIKWIGIAIAGLFVLQKIVGIVTLISGAMSGIGASGAAAGAGGKALGSLGSGLSKLGSGGALKGVLAMAGIAATLYILGKALGVFAEEIAKFNNVSWESLGKAAAVLVVFTGAIFGLGAILMGGGAFIFGAGIAGMLALSLAIYALGKAMQEMVPAVPAFTAVFDGLAKIIKTIGGVIVKIINTITDGITTIIKTVATSISELAQINPLKLTALGLALAAVGTGLLALTAGEVVSGIANFFGASPVDTLKGLESIDGVKIGVTASSIVTLAVAIKTLSNEFEKFGDIIDKVNTSKLKEIKSLSSSISAAKAVDTVVGGIKSAGKAITSFFGGKEEKATTTTEKGGITVNIQPVVDEIRLLKNEFINFSKNINSAISNRPIQVVLNIDGKEIKRLLVTGPNTFNN